MRSLIVNALFVCSMTAVMVARGPEFHVRGLDAWANESIERGITRSPLIRELAGRLAATDVIVHVETSTSLSKELAGTTRFAHASAEYRYVRITLDRALDPFRRAATLAHELQHALELAASGARSHDDVRRLYTRIGHRIDGRDARYETAAAREVGAQAWKELRGLRVTRSAHR